MRFRMLCLVCCASCGLSNCKSAIESAISGSVFRRFSCGCWRLLAPLVRLQISYSICDFGVCFLALFSRLLVVVCPPFPVANQQQYLRFRSLFSSAFLAVGGPIFPAANQQSYLRFRSLFLALFWRLLAPFVANQQQYLRFRGLFSGAFLAAVGGCWPPLSGCKSAIVSAISGSVF